MKSDWGNWVIRQLSSEGAEQRFLKTTKNPHQMVAGFQKMYLMN